MLKVKKCANVFRPLIVRWQHASSTVSWSWKSRHGAESYHAIKVNNQWIIRKNQVCHVIDVRRLHISRCTHIWYHSYLLHVSYFFKCDWAHGMFFKKNSAHVFHVTVVFIQRLPGRRRPWSKRCRSSAPWSYMKFRGNLAEKKRRMKKSADNSVEILWTKRGFEPFCFIHIHSLASLV